MAHTDHSEIEKVNNQFYEALNLMLIGDLSLMISIWSHTADVTYIGPEGDIVVGWSQVQNRWEEQAAMNIGGEVLPRNVHFITNETLAIAQNWEIGNTLIDGKSKKVALRVSNIYRKEDGKWKMVSHQTDPLSILDRRSFSS